MNKQQYIKRVRKGLSCSRSRKKDILRDLEEAFASSLEHGEAEEQIIERLGAPEEFAAGMSDMNYTRKRKLARKTAVILCTIAVVAVIGTLAAVYAPVLFVRGNPIPYLKAVNQLDEGNSFATVEDKDADNVVLITSDPDGLDVIEYVSKTYGVVFDMRVGDTFVFAHGKKKSIKVPVGTEPYLDKYIVWDIPKEITELPPNHDLLDFVNGPASSIILNVTIDEFHELVGEPAEINGDWDIYYNCNGEMVVVFPKDDHLILFVGSVEEGYYVGE